MFPLWSAPQRYETLLKRKLDLLSLRCVMVVPLAEEYQKVASSLLRTGRRRRVHSRGAVQMGECPGSSGERAVEDGACLARRFVQVTLPDS
jgi:hypothetical protein